MACWRQCEPKVTFDNEGNVNGLTTDFITNYAKTVNVDPNTTATAGTDNTATLGGLTVGTYMILVTPTTTGVTYNPMIRQCKLQHNRKR